MGLFDPDRIPPELRFDIREFGTGVVPGVDCSQAIAAAIAAAVAVPDPALVYFPPGRWVVSPQMARTTSTTTITAQGHAIVVPAAGEQRPAEDVVRPRLFLVVGRERRQFDYDAGITNLCWSKPD